MAKKDKIKGITIEINGDVTKLDKALGSVDESLKTTQTNLKDVEKLLKLDPKNVELLDQKQRLLSQGVEQTANRYELLKKTLEESTASNVRYEKWEAAQSSLQGQITKTQNALTALKKEGEKLQGLGFAPDSTEMVELQKRMDATTDKAEALRKEMADTYEELGRPISIDQYDALQRELVEAKKDMEDAAKAAEDFSPELAAAAANAQELAGKMGGVSSKAKSVSDAFAPVTKAIAGVGAALVANVAATEDYRASLSMLEANAQRAGVSVGTTEEALRRFNGVTGETGASIEAISNLLNAGLDDNNLLRAVDLLSGAVINFPETLKIESLADSLQETLATGSATGQFGELLERLGVDLDTFNAAMAQTPDIAARQTLALQELAKSGYGELNDSWVKNNAGLLESRDATKEFKDSMVELAETVLPFVTKLTEMMSDLVVWFTELPEGVQATIGAMAGLIALVSPIAGFISNVTSGVGKLLDKLPILQEGLSNIWALLQANPIASVITLIGLLVAAFVTLYQKCEWFRDVVDSIFSSIMETIQGVIDWIGGAVDAVKGFLGFGRKNNDTSGVSPQSVGVSGFASGGVFEPNSPMLGILGDNKTEREVAAPESMLQGMVDQAVARAGGGRSATVVNIRFTGSLAQLGRILGPVVTAETQRQGPSL